jgi:DNA-damage-inducible protein D
MTANLPATATAPFDAIRIVTLEGREYWSARELMPLLGYERWENFAEAIGRAKVAAHNTGYDVALNFPGATKVAASGPAAADYHLSRYAAYLTALNGDPRKPEIAAAQSYFVIKTREAETHHEGHRLPSKKELAQWFIESEERAERAELARDHAVAFAEELVQPASAWLELADAAGDYSVADAAKVLSRDSNITTGRDRLFKSMQGFSWVYRYDGHWRAYQAQVDCGRLTEKIGRPYYHAGRDELVGSEPTIRITPKGLQELHKRLGGGSAQLALMAVSE